MFYSQNAVNYGNLNANSINNELGTRDIFLLI